MYNSLVSLPMNNSGKNRRRINISGAWLTQNLATFQHSSLSVHPILHIHNLGSDDPCIPVREIVTCMHPRVMVGSHCSNDFLALHHTWPRGSSFALMPGYGLRQYNQPQILNLPYGFGRPRIRGPGRWWSRDIKGRHLSGEAVVRCESWRDMWRRFWWRWWWRDGEIERRKMWKCSGETWLRSRSAPGCDLIYSEFWILKRFKEVSSLYFSARFIFAIIFLHGNCNCLCEFAAFSNAR